MPSYSRATLDWVQNQQEILQSDSPAEPLASTCEKQCTCSKSSLPSINRPEVSSEHDEPTAPPLAPSPMDSGILPGTKRHRSISGDPSGEREPRKRGRLSDEVASSTRERSGTSSPRPDARASPERYGFSVESNINTGRSSQ